MSPTQIQAARVVLGLVAVGLFDRSFVLGLISIGLFVVAEALDALDGYVARRRGLASAFGGILDISTDQVIEAMYWFRFVSLGLVPLWIPIVITVRGTLINLMRVRALEAGAGAFGAGGRMRSAWGRALVASHVSRGLMVAVKVAGFAALQLAFLLGRSGAPLEALGTGLVYGLAAIHVIRGVLYVADGRDLLRTFGWSAAREPARAARPPARRHRRARPAGPRTRGSRARGLRRRR
jgi:CDP-diacylglycerol---glycerol-3-phosphate 3-phosphatidyltransferase